MLNLIKLIAAVIISSFALNISIAQVTESFETNFYPLHWNGNGWNKTKSKHHSGNYSAISSFNSNKREDNFISFENVSLGNNTSLNFYHHGHNGNKNLELKIYIKNAEVNNGDSILINTLVPVATQWNIENINFPSQYNNTDNNTIYFVVEHDNTMTIGNDKVYIDDVTLNSPLPVTLEYFTHQTKNNTVNLKWKSSYEQNNKGFEIERLTGGNWEKIGFTEQTNSHIYLFTDNNLQTGRYNYRLKQIDINGNFEYHNLNSEVIIEAPSKYSLSQNYPNPFNPSTKISFQLPKEEKVSIKVYDNTGKEISTIYNGVKAAGYHTIEYKNEFPSGVYYYRLITSEFSETKKMLVIK
jgi:hypothetical protein